jgi:hypothetical protein
MLALASTMRWRRIIVIATIFNSVAFFTVPLLLRGTTLILPVAGSPPPLGAGRYFLIPGLFIAVCVAALLDRAVTERTAPSTWVGGIATTWLVVVLAINFPITPLPNGPSWGDGVDAARRQCNSEPVASIEVVIAPSETWTVQLACADL